MEQQISQQNQTAPAPGSAGLSLLQKDLIISATVGVLCAAFILPIAKNLEMKQALALSLFLVLPVLSVAGMGAAYWLARKIKIFYQLAKFILVGALNSLIDWGILNLLMFLTSLTAGTMFSVFKGISFLVAMANSYFWNKFWTFKKTEEPGDMTDTAQKNGKEMGQFFVVSLIGFALNVGVATLLVNILGPQWGLSAKLWANAGALAGTLIGMGWNFVGYKLIVFKD